MFGLGRGKKGGTSAAVRLFELTIFPDGEVIDQSWHDAFAGEVAKPSEGKIVWPFEVQGMPCRLDATLRDGDAILSMWADDRIVTSSLLLSSRDSELNAMLTSMYLDSIRDIDLVRELTNGREGVFGEIERRTETPLLVTLLMPLSSRGMTDVLIDRQRAWVAAVVG